MAEDRGTEKTLKRDQHSTRDIREEIEEEIHSGPTKPRQEQPNRDRARGDWDRSGDHRES
jgi:hypothetical protein